MSAQPESLDLVDILSGPDVPVEVRAPKGSDPGVSGFQIRDHKTGLYNRDYMLRRLGEEIQRSRRYGTPFSLAVIGVDRFASVNTSYGWHVGDQVLHGVGRALYKSLRGPDLVGRLKGAQFLALLPNVVQDKAVIALERVRADVTAYRYGDAVVAATVSAGVVEFWGGDMLGMVEDAVVLMRKARREGLGVVAAPGTHRPTLED